jgi:hypothetical protein
VAVGAAIFVDMASRLNGTAGAAQVVAYVLHRSGLLEPERHRVTRSRHAGVKRSCHQSVWVCRPSCRRHAGSLDCLVRRDEEES